MNLNLCSLCYRPVLRGVNLSNGTMIHEHCLLSAQKKESDLRSKINERKGAMRNLDNELRRRESFGGKVSALFSGVSSSVGELRARSETLNAEIQFLSKQMLVAELELSQIYDHFLDYPPDFEERKKQVTGRDGECCSSCGCDRILHLHHIQPLSNGGNNKLENLTLLCEGCHSKAHNNRSVTESFKNQGTAYAKRVDDLQHAIKNGHRITFGYKKPRDKGHKSRTIQPIELFTMDHERDSGSTLCVRGFCELRQEKRNFSIKRMRGLKIL